MAEGGRTGALGYRTPGRRHTPAWESGCENRSGERLGNAEEYASLALEMVKTGYFNGEDVRLDGAIRMAPR